MPYKYSSIHSSQSILNLLVSYCGLLEVIKKLIIVLIPGQRQVLARKFNLSSSTHIT